MIDSQLALTIFVALVMVELVKAMISVELDKSMYKRKMSEFKVLNETLDNALAKSKKLEKEKKND